MSGTFTTPIPDAANLQPLGIVGSRPKLSREQYRRQKELEELRKAGKLPRELDADGKEINPYIPQFISQAPWYADSKDGAASLRHQRHKAQQEISLQDAKWYERGKRIGPAATKYRKGACANCGAMTHQAKECMERPRKTGARWTGQDIRPDETIMTVDATWDSKRDRWNGFNPKEHEQVVTRYELEEEAIQTAKRRKTSEEEAAADAAAGAADDDETQYDECADMPGQKFDADTRMSTRNLRLREDTAKYLLNLDVDSPHYDPKTRSMKEKASGGSGEDSESVEAGFRRSQSVEVEQVRRLQQAAYATGHENSGAGVDSFLEANPTKGARMLQQQQAQREQAKSIIQTQILDRYGGAEHLVRPPPELLTTPDDYKEYAACDTAENVPE